MTRLYGPLPVAPRAHLPGAPRLLVSCERGSFTWAAVREYLAGGFGPGEGVAALVPAADVGLDGGDEAGDRGEAAAADGLPGDDREEDFHHVQPRPRGGREVQGDPGVLRQPGPHVRVVVRAVVVADDVQLAAGVSLRDLAEKLQELLVPVPGVAGAGHLAGRGLQRGEQCGGAVPDVVVAALFRGA